MSVTTPPRVREMREESITTRRNEGAPSRPRRLVASVATVVTTFGEVTAAIGQTASGAPHEVFLRGTAPGSDAATVVEAIARLASLALQLPSVVPPQERLRSIIEVLDGLSGAHPTSSMVIGSIPVAVAVALTAASRGTRKIR